MPGSSAGSPRLSSCVRRGSGAGSPRLSSCAHRGPGGGARGFILVLVLWLLAAIAVIVGLLVYVARERVLAATEQRTEIEARIAMIGTRDTLLYLAASVPMTSAGLPLEALSARDLASARASEFGAFDQSPRGGELHLDGRPYLGLGAISVALQDESGLTPLGFPVAAPLAPLFAAAGVPRQQHAALAAALLDYTDADDRRRPGGAEAAAYAAAGLAPPANRPLLAVPELGRVLGWRALEPEALALLQEWATVGYGGAMNLNSAPPTLLVAMLPGCAAICRERIGRRGAQPFSSGRDFERATATRLPGDRDFDFRVGPSEYLRITMWGASGMGWRVHVRLTPFADRAAPWAVAAAYRVPRPRTDDVSQPIPSPLFATPTLAERRP